MILLERKVHHRLINTKCYQYLEAHWDICMEESDIPDPTMRERFHWVRVTQRKNLAVNSGRSWDNLTWFKGARTNTFGKETKDRQKQQIIEMVEKYLLDNNVPIIHHYEKAQINND